MDKLISIIIPCYNVQSYIDRCFQSLLAQTIGFDRLEIIWSTTVPPTPHGRS